MSDKQKTLLELVPWTYLGLQIFWALLQLWSKHEHERYNRQQKGGT
jgi:hypothetical protein